MKWLTNGLLAVSHGGAAWLAWILHGASQEGSVSPSGTAGIAVLSVATVLAFWKAVELHWRAAGGKFDGHVTDDEARAVIDAAAETLKLPAPAVQAVEALAGNAASLANGLIAWMTTTFTDAAPPHESKPDKVALLETAHQAIAWELAGDPAGSAAIATVLERLHKVWNPQPAQEAQEKKAA